MRIVFYCGHTPFEWSPESTQKGIGGSEEATINLAFELSKLDWEVVVYNRCGDNEGFYYAPDGKLSQGVQYENYEYFDDVDADIVVFWRQPNYIWQMKDKYKATKTFLWLHDTVPESELLPIKHFVDGVFVLSGFHSSLYPNMRDKLIKTQNAINLSDFNQDVKRDPYKIVYGSSYDRGLKELLEMWSEIKAYEPRATLDVFYGMDLIQDEHFKDEIKHLLKQEGVTDFGRISHKEVAKEFLSAGVWCYPCWFPEISCITAIKAQVGGAIPVITPTAALQETVKFGFTTREPRDHIGEMPWGTEMPERLMDQFVSITRKALDPKEQERIRKVMMIEARENTWARVARSWSNLFGVLCKSGK